MIVAVRRLRYLGYLPGPNPTSPIRRRLPTPSISNPDVPPSGRYTNKLSAYISLSFCKSISRSRTYNQSPDPDFSFTRFSQKLGQNVLGTRFVTRGKGCWLCEAGAFVSRVVYWREVKNGRVRRVVLCCVLVCRKKRGVGSS